MMAARTDAPAEAGGRELNLRDLRRVVERSQGPREVLAIVNAGDGGLVEDQLRRLRRELFRADGATTVLAHEEPVRRGQLLGLLDAVRHWREARGAFDPHSVALGVMMPGQGTRLSPLTQRLHGIKPFLPMPVRHRAGGEWFTGAAASLYSWTLLACHLKRMGFRGVAWKWGDEPQIASNVLAKMHQDLSEADAVRFGAQAVVTDDLAANKEWLLAAENTQDLLLQVRRRPRARLLERFGVSSEGDRGFFQAHIHLGSPAFSHLFLEEAETVFGGLPGCLDVDGYLFEALTHDPVAWRAEVESDSGLRTLLAEHPDFYERVRELKGRIELRRGHPLVVKVIDLGEGLYWGDIGQLDKARAVFAALNAEGAEGDFARRLALMDDCHPDAFGNRLLGKCLVPSDGSVRDSVIVDSEIHPPASVRGAVIMDSELGAASIVPGSVVLRGTVLGLRMGAEALSFASVGREVVIAGRQVHTSIPTDPARVSSGLEDWRADSRTKTPGKGLAYTEARFGNPGSFQRKFEQMRQRQVAPEVVEALVEEHFRLPLRREIRDIRSDHEPPKKPRTN
ncbi:MAG: hypothetical protein V2A77_04970 [Pseudomonadota bacterium]